MNVWGPPKQIEAICGPNVVLEMQALRDGSLLIKTKSSRQTKQLLKQTTFCLKPVTVTLHATRNSSKGTIFAPELKFMSEEELLEEMRGDGVTHVRRLTTFRDGARRDTSLLVLTFSSPRLPLKLKTGYLSYDVNVFVPNPLRCFACQRFGHAKGKCTQPARCNNCGDKAHEGVECAKPQKCVSCDSTDHTTTSKDCPIWIKEKKDL